MSTDRDVTTRIVRSWLHEDAYEDADRILNLVLNDIDTTPQRRASWLARRFPPVNNNVVRFGAAAVVIALAIIVAASVLPGLNVGGPTASPSPSIAASLSPQATATPSGPMSLLDSPDAGDLPPGDYYLDLPAYPARIDFTVPEGWRYWYSGPSSRAASDAQALLVDSFDTGAANGSAWGLSFTLVDKVRVDPCDLNAGYMEPSVTQSSETLAAALGTYADFPATSVEDVTIGGFSGKRVELAPADTVTCRGVILTTPASYEFEFGPPGREPFDSPLQFTFLDVDGSVLVIWTTDYPGTNGFEVDGGASPDPQAHLADQVELHQILDSVVITPH